MTKPKKKPQPKKRNKHTFGPGNKFAFKPKAELDDLPVEEPNGTEITPRQLLRITDFVAQGWRASDMRFAVNMTPAVWEEYYRTHPEVADAIAKGECRLHNTVFAAQLKKVRKGDFMAAALIMNGRFGYRDPDSEGGGSRVQVNVINLPGALPDSNVIEGDVVPEPEDDDSDVVEIREIPAIKPNGATDPTPTQHIPRTPATHRQVGAAVIALTLTEKMHQARALAAGRPDPYASEPAMPEPTERPRTEKERQAFADAQFKFGLGTDTTNMTPGELSRWNKGR
jgi:hypothetical protein